MENNRERIQNHKHHPKKLLFYSINTARHETCRHCGKEITLYNPGKVKLVFYLLSWLNFMLFWVFLALLDSFLSWSLVAVVLASLLLATIVSSAVVVIIGQKSIWVSASTDEHSTGDDSTY